MEHPVAVASISRTTAYRYFPTKRALLLAAHPEMEQASMLPENPPDDAAGRLDAVVSALTGRVPLAAGELQTLVAAVRATIGIEALVWLVDVAGMSRADACELMRWSAQALLDAAIAHPPPLIRQARPAAPAED